MIQIRRFPVTIALIVFMYRLVNLDLYHHHDLPSILYSLRCWCFPFYTPYGYLWYLVNYPLSWNYPLLIALVDFPVMLLLSRYKLFYLYTFCSWWIYQSAPYDMSIMWLSLLGIFNPLLLIVAPLAKLPDSAAMWKFTLGRPVSPNDFEYYLLTALPWIYILSYHLHQYWNKPIVS